MFTIIGGDGKEYGPVSADQIRAWITAGRANFETQAKPAGSGEWRCVGDLPEFSAEAAPRASDLPPPVPVATGATYAPTWPVPAAASAPLAGRVERLLAQLLDNVVFLACALPGALMMAFAAVRSGFRLSMNLDGLAQVAGIMPGVVVFALAAVALAVVQVWMLATRGQTIGKRVMDVRIVKLADDGPPGFTHAFLLRVVVVAMIGMLPMVGPLFSLVDILFIFRDDRRCLHDFIAGTKVVKV